MALSKVDTLVLIPLRTGFILTRAPYKDECWTIGKRLVIDDKRENVAAFTTLGDVLFYIAELYGIQVKEYLTDALVDDMGNGGENDIDGKKDKWKFDASLAQLQVT